MAHRKDIPLEQRDIIPVNRGETLDVSRANLVSFNYILRTGDVRAHEPLSPGYLGNRNYQIDFASDDSYTRALKTIEAATTERVAKSEPLQALLQKDKWTQKDRTAWEEQLTTIVTEETAKIPGLKAYRSESKPHGEYNPSGDATRYPRINALAKDIDKDATHVEYDCEAMSVTKGIILQKIENRFLPPDAPQKDFKQAMNYYYATGGVNSSLGGGAHAFILTPAGGIVESTTAAGVLGYLSQMGGNTIEQFARGHSINSGIIYGANSKAEYDAEAAARYGNLPHGWANDKIYTANDLAAKAGQKNTQVIVSKDGSLILVTKATGVGKDTAYEATLYQKQNIGSPHEGYRAVAGDAKDKVAPGQDVHLFRSYSDALSGEKFGMDMRVDPQGVMRAEILKWNASIIPGLGGYEKMAAEEIQARKVTPALAAAPAPAPIN